MRRMTSARLKNKLVQFVRAAVVLEDDGHAADDLSISSSRMDTADQAITDGIPSS
jgi:hypothetical protein